MTDGDYFFLIFLSAIAATRLLLLNRKMMSPTVHGFRLRHYMYGAALIAFSFLVPSLTVYAIGFALLVDEIPALLVKGLGYREEHWTYEDYYAPWSVAGVLVLICFIYIFHTGIVGLLGPVPFWR